MNIKNLSYILVTINLVFVVKEIPLAIVGFIFTILILSILLKNKSLRTFTKFLILAISFAILKISFKPLLVPEAGVSFILILSALKLWELESDTDFYNMFLILALAEGTLFLLIPTLPMFITGFLKIALFFYFLLKLRNYNVILLNFRRVLYLMVPALLFSMMLFYLFPRFTKGFSSTPNSHGFISAPTSSLTFNKLGPITPSTKIIFRAYGLAPSPRTYWKSRILWGSNGEEWTTSNDSIQTRPNPPTNDYQIRMSDNFNDYLPTLDGQSKIKNSSEEFYSYEDGSFRLKNITKREVHFEVTSNKDLASVRFSKNMSKMALRLLSPRKLELTKNILGENKPELLSDQQRLELALTYFKNKHFEYSLNPPMYQSVEEFIISGKTGYCSHFAAAFLFIARIYNLPSRIISGFQGGEFNPYDKSIIVRELDGHAWVEVYITGKGWLRIDPTEMVVPTLIANGASKFNDQLDPNINLYYFSVPKSYLNFAAINTTSLWLDALNMRFNEVLMNFNKDEQLRIIKKFIPNLPVESLFALLLILPGLIFFTLSLYFKNIAMSPEEKRYLKFLKKMKGLGLEKLSFETATAFKNRCLKDIRLRNDLHALMESETNYYINSFYKT